MLCHVNTRRTISSFLKSFVSKVGDITTILVFFFLELLPEALYQLWRETFSLLWSEVNWSCNLKSLPIKDSAQMRVVREHLPNINLTFTREPQHRCSCLLTRIRKFFPVHRVQRSPQLAYVCLKYGPVKHMFSCTKVRRNKLLSFSKISADVFSLLYFKMSLHSHLLNFFIEKILLGWRGCKLFWICGSWVQEISWFASQFHGRCATQGHLCNSHRCCFAHQLGRSDLCHSGLVP